MSGSFSEVFGVAKPVIGMVHLRALPGAPRYADEGPGIEDAMMYDASVLADAGVDALLLENFGDAPFYPRRVPPWVISHMTRLATLLRQQFSRIPLGINVLRNDGCAAMAIAHAVGARFIRVNLLCGARVTDQGLLEGIAHELMRLKRQLWAEKVEVFADINVKHSMPVGSAPIEDEVADTIRRGLADAVIVTGPGTGRSVNTEELVSVKHAAGEIPVLVGSGVTDETGSSCLVVGDGLIVGSWVKQDGIVTRPVDPERVRRLMKNIGR